MNGFMNWMEQKFVPVAQKISAEKHLVAIRDSFISILPITMVGSVAVLLNVFFRDLPNNAGMTGFVEAMQPLIQINGVVWFASLAILSLVFIVALGYNLSTSYKVNPLAGALVALGSFIAFLPQSAKFDLDVNGTMIPVDQWGYINVNYLGATGLFAAMIIGFISTLIFCNLMLKNITIKLPDSVPPAVNKAFTSLIPGIVAVYVCSILSFVITKTTGSSLNDLISMYIQTPLLGLSQGIFSVALISFLIQLFWFFGLHGHNVLGPIIEGIYQPALLANADHIAKGGTIDTLPYIWTRGSFEPIIFGLPIVLNPIYIIPFLLAPTLGSIIAYVATKLGIVPPVYVAVPWVLPPGLYAFFATGGSIMAALVSLFNVLVAFVLYTPFVILANRVKDK